MDYLTDYNPDWPAWFAAIRDYLLPQLSPDVRIEHVGSTSIAGMAAKPIIDIDLVVPAGAMAEAMAAIESSGYRHQGDLGIAGREAFEAISEAAQALPPHHLYACEEGAYELRKHLAFRDYLRAHPDEAVRLCELKRALAFGEQVTRAEYIERKAPLVAEITAKALAWRYAEQTF